MMFACAAVVRRLNIHELHTVTLYGVGLPHTRPYKARAAAHPCLAKPSSFSVWTVPSGSLDFWIHVWRAYTPLPSRWK